MAMSPRLLWVASAVLGIATAVLTGSFGLLAAFLALVLAVPLVLRGDALAALSGLLVGFGAMWLALLAWQAASGGQLSDPRPWILVGAAPLAIGLAAFVIRLARSFGRCSEAASR